MKTFLGRAVAVTALCVATVGGTAGTANAMPISTIKSECNAASGRFWTEYTSGRISGYACGYTDTSGNYWIDFYDRYGNYRFTG